jgi:hypothetical protein
VREDLGRAVRSVACGTRLAAVGIVAALVDTSLLRRKLPAVRAGRSYCCTPPERPTGPPLPAPAPGHVVPMLGRMLLVLVVAVASVPAVVDGTAWRCRKNGHLRPGFVPGEL